MNYTDDSKLWSALGEIAEITEKFKINTKSLTILEQEFSACKDRHESLLSPTSARKFEEYCERTLMRMSKKRSFE